MIIEVTKNRLGTASITAAFAGMRKAQSFTVYPQDHFSDEFMIQSQTRIGYVNVSTGKVRMTPPKSSGAYFIDFNIAEMRNTMVECVIPAEELVLLRAGIRATGDATITSACGVIQSNNIGAMVV